MIIDTVFSCFISHPWAGHIHHFALRLTTALRQHKLKVWVDEEQMQVGQSIKDRQKNGIVYETDVFIFVVAPETLRSTNCMDELNIALKNGKPIVSAILERCELPLKLQEKIFVDFTSPTFFEASIEKLVEGVKKLNEIQEIIKLLSDDNPETRIEAVCILSDLQESSALQPIMKRISIERDESVTYWLLVAVGTLFELNSQDEIQVLKMLDHFEKASSFLVKQGVIDARKKMDE